MTRPAPPALLTALRAANRNMRARDIRILLVNKSAKATTDAERQEVDHAIAWLDWEQGTPRRPVITERTDPGTAMHMRRHHVASASRPQAADSTAAIMADIEARLNHHTARLDLLEAELAGLKKGQASKPSATPQDPLRSRRGPKKG